MGYLLGSVIGYGIALAAIAEILNLVMKIFSKDKNNVNANGDAENKKRRATAYKIAAGIIAVAIVLRIAGR